MSAGVGGCHFWLKVPGALRMMRALCFTREDVFTMPLWQILFLAVVQGATEFIPVSSSGHLVLAREWMGWSDHGGVVMDVVLHAGSLLAVVLYFWRDWLAVGRAWLQPRGADDPAAAFHRRLPLLLVVATIPIILTGPTIGDHLETFRHAVQVGGIMLLAAGWFAFCEWKKRERSPFGMGQALFVGVVQVAALLPGASRSGLTTGAGMLAGLPRTEAARFAFFMALPAIGGAILIKSPAIVHAADVGWTAGQLWFAFLSCFAVSIASIHICLSFFRRHSLMVFGGYLVVIGILSIVTGLV